MEGILYQTKYRNPKDKIAYLVRLNDRLACLLAAVEAGDAAPTCAHYEVFDVLKSELDRIMSEAELLLQTEVPAAIGFGRTAGGRHVLDGSGGH